MTSRARLHQIFYSDATRVALDPGFTPLDNLANERPDWREYWPIRRVLLTETLDETCFHGFFSPKFGEKTGLKSDDCLALIARAAPDTDVVLFSPFYDQIAFYWNIFEQAVSHHRGLLPTFQAAAALVQPGVAIESLITDSTNTVFSNFFAARPPFWRAWLAANERLFAEAESGTGPLHDGLNAEAIYGPGPVAAKVFMMERVATLLLASQPGWKVLVRDPHESPAEPLFAMWQDALMQMDALKIASRQEPQRAPEFFAAFRDLQRNIAAQSRAQHAAAGDNVATGSTG